MHLVEKEKKRSGQMGSGTDNENLYTTGDWL